MLPPMRERLARLTRWSYEHPRRAALMAGLAGMIAALGQAPFGIWIAPLMAFAFGFGLWQGATSPRRAGLVGWAMGAGYFLVTLHWIVEPFLVDIARHGWMAPFALPMMAGGLALFWGGVLWGAAHPKLARLMPGARFAVALTLAELLRGWIFTGFPWGGPGAAWIDTPFAALAAFGGVISLSFLTFLLAAALWSAAFGGLRAWAALSLPIAAFLLVAFQLSGPATYAEDAPRLRLVQPNAPQHQKWDPAYMPIFFARALSFSAAPPDGAPLDLVIWPETSVPSYIGRDPAIEARVAGAASGVPVVAGIFDREGAASYNALALFDPRGAPAWVYRKFHLVPFGEYVPLGELAARLGIHGLAATDGKMFAAGPGPRVFEMPNGVGTVQPIICYEAIFSRDLRAAPERPDWVLQATNDAWFGRFAGPQQHLVQARFRAIEMGLPVVRAANTGISAMIDPAGRVTAYLGLGEEGYLDVDLPAPGDATLFARYGNAPLWGFLVLAVFISALPLRAKDVDPAPRPQ